MHVKAFYDRRDRSLEITATVIRELWWITWSGSTRTAISMKALDSTFQVARRRHIGAGEASSGLRYDETVAAGNKS